MDALLPSNPALRPFLLFFASFLPTCLGLSYCSGRELIQHIIFQVFHFKGLTILCSEVGHSLVALGVALLEIAQSVIGAAGINRDLVVESATADVVDLVQGIPYTVLIALAVLGERVFFEDVAGLDRPELAVLVCAIPSAAETEGLLGAVLAVRAVTSVQESTETVVTVALGLAWRKSIRGAAAAALVRVFHLGLVVSGHMDKEVPLLWWVALSRRARISLSPEGRGGIRIACGIILGKDREERGGAEKKPLEGNHDECRF